MIPKFSWFAIVMLISTSLTVMGHAKRDSSTLISHTSPIEHTVWRRDVAGTTENVPSSKMDTSQISQRTPVPEIHARIPVKEAHILKARLNTFVARLKEFAQGSRFAVEGFEASGESLDKTLTTITEAISKAGDPDVQLALQLGFAQYMFQTMGEAIEGLKHFKAIKGPGHNLVWPLIDLNVRLLALCNVHGAPDSSIDGYAHRVSLYKRYLQMMKDALGEYAYVPFGIKMSFKRYFDRAQDVLGILASHL